MSPTPRRNLGFALRYALLVTSLAGCESVVSPDSAPEPQRLRMACIQPAYDTYSDCEREPIDTIDRCVDDFGRIYPCPPPVTDRTVYADAYSVSVEADNRNAADIETLVQYEQQQGYQSLRAYLDPYEWTEWSAAANEGTTSATGSEGTAQANDGVVRDDFPFGDGFLSLLNHRGELQVGDSVYKITRDNAYAVHVRDIELLRQLVPTLSSPAPAPDARVVAAPVETTTPGEGSGPLYAGAAEGGAERSLGFSTGTCTWTVGDRRMKGKVYITSALVYSEAGIKTDWERRKWFGWSNTWQPGTLEYAYTTASLRVGASNYVFPTSGSGFRTGTASVSRVIASEWFKQIRGTINGTHTSPVGQCYTRVSRD